MNETDFCLLKRIGKYKEGATTTEYIIQIKVKNAFLSHVLEHEKSFKMIYKTCLLD